MQIERASKPIRQRISAEVTRRGLRWSNFQVMGMDRRPYQMRMQLGEIRAGQEIDQRPSLASAMRRSANVNILAGESRQPDKAPEDEA